VVPGADRLVRLGFDSRRHADENAPNAGGRGALDLVEGVDDDEAGAVFGRGPQLVVGLVVAVHDEALGRHAGLERERELAQGGHVGAEPFVGEQPEECDVGKGLRPVGDERVGSRVAVGARLGEQRPLAVDDERRPELPGERRGANPAQDQLATLDRRTLWEELEHRRDSAAALASAPGGC
jgi:hypothetical protein